ncbi:MAG: Asd/ArgC dimerization domain-containing protein [Acidobacteriota bacterium]
MPSIDIVHPTTLLGKEVRERIDAFPSLSGDLRLLSPKETEVGTLTEARGEAAVVVRLGQNLPLADIVLFCGSIEETRPLLVELPATSTGIVLSPWATVADGTPVVAGVNLSTAKRGMVLVSPSAGAVGLARLLQPLRPLGVMSASATVLQPASLHGDEALQELFDQARNILTFAAPPPSPIFDGQMAFNMRLGPPDGTALRDHLASVLDDSVELSAQTVQAGIFHGVSVSVELRFAMDPGAEAIQKAWRDTDGIEIFEPGNRLGPIDAAQSDMLLLGELRAEPQRPGTYWAWATIDNLTAAGAINALHLADAVVG